jgi:hypothetical protein
MRTKVTNPKNMTWFRVPVKLLSLGIILLMIFNVRYQIIRHVERFLAIKLITNETTCQISRSKTARALPIDLYNTQTLSLVQYYHTQ